MCMGSMGVVIEMTIVIQRGFLGGATRAIGVEKTEVEVKRGRLVGRVQRHRESSKWEQASRLAMSTIKRVMGVPLGSAVRLC